MQECEQVNLANQDLERIGQSFLAHTRKLKRTWSPKSRTRSFGSHGGFAGLWPENKTYHEYKFFEEVIEGSILGQLVNPALDSLFRIFEVRVFWPPSQRKAIAFTRTIENYEKNHDFEFIIDYERERVGFLYRHPDVIGNDLYKLIRKWGLDRIEVIDWTDVVSRSPSRENSWLTYEGREYVTDVSVRAFFEKHFPVHSYEAFMAHLTNAVARANDLIGFQTIPSLSLAHVSDFKTEVLNGIASMRADLRSGVAYQIDGVGQTCLAPEDLERLDANLFNKGLYRCLAGSEDFAVSFVTSEFLRKSFSDNEQFDYTAVICGYLKSVEQLEYNLMKQTLGVSGTDSLWIKRNGRRILSRHKVRIQGKNRPQPNPVAFKRIRREHENNFVNHVQFAEDYERYFDTSLIPLANLLHDNETWWKLTEDGRSYVYEAIRTFAKEDRNGYFHKDNLRDPEKVKEVRDSVLAVLLLLIGGYEVPGSLNERHISLGIESNRFDELYSKVVEIPKSERDFILEFGNGPIKAVRLFDQEDETQDEEGHIDSKIVFARVDDYRIEDYEGFLKSLRDEDYIELSRYNMPTSVTLVLTYRPNMLIW